MRLSHQRSEVGDDLGGLGIDGKVPLFRYPAEDEGEPRAQGNREATVGRRAVADNGRTVEVTTEARAHELDDRRVRLTRHDGVDTSGCGHGGEDGAPSRNGPCRRRV